MGKNPSIHIRGVLGVPKIFGDMGMDAGGTFAEIEREIRDLGNVDEIDLYIFSPGGSVRDGMALHDLIERHPARFNGIVDGFCASAATYALQACDVRIVPKNAQVMIHNATTYAEGDHRAMERVARDLRRESRIIGNLYADRIAETTGEQDVPALRNRIFAMMDEETSFTGEECVEIGLADQVGAEIDLPATFEAAVANLGTLNLSILPEKVRPLFDRPTPTTTASEPINVMSEESAPVAVEEEAAAPAAEPVAPAAPENTAAPASAPAVEPAAPAPVAAAPATNDAAIADALTNFSKTLTSLTEKLEAQSSELENLKNFQASGANPSAWGNHAPAAAPASPAEPTNELSANASPHEKISFGLRNILGKDFDAPRRG